jgi:DNA adenine methylase
MLHLHTEKKLSKKHSILESQICKPFLRWAGGKRWLLKQIDSLLPLSGFKQYHEPFLGGGAILFHLNPNISFISDINGELINAYLAVKEDVSLVITYLKKFQNNKEKYYQIRNSTYKCDYQKAAQFIYLNQMSFNGIYRVNSKGEYNVPYGYRDKYQFDYSNLVVVSSFLKKVNISKGDFYDAIGNVKKGDLVFLDPPYTVAHDNNGFIEYSKKIFSYEDQKRLSQFIGQIKEVGAYYIMTNANHISLKEIFNIHKDNILEVERNSLIGGFGAKRGKYHEIIMTNGEKG